MVKGEKISKFGASVAALLVICATVAASSANAKQLFLFGGKGHDIFLGCINCSKYDDGSICNKYGSGNKYAEDSIFNRYGTFGSKYSEASPWNKYATGNTVPVIVDDDGNFYGYFSINKYRSDAMQSAAELAELYENANGDLQAIQNFMCDE